MDPKGDRLRKIQSGQLKLPDSVLKVCSIVIFKKINQYSSCGIDSHACLPSYITSSFAYFFHAYGIILIA